MNELPSMEEFEKLVAESFQSELMPAENVEAETSGQPPMHDAERNRPVIETVTRDPLDEKAGSWLQPKKIQPAEEWLSDLRRSTRWPPLYTSIVFVTRP